MLNVSGNGGQTLTHTEASAASEHEHWGPQYDRSVSYVVLSVEMQPRVVHVHPGLTSLAARDRNFTDVASALEKAGIDYFAVRGASDLSSVIGVGAKQRERVLETLRALCQRQPGYISSVKPAPPVASAPAPAEEAEAWRAVAKASVVRLTWYRTEFSHNLIYGPEYGCEIEFWEDDAERGQMIAPRPNRITPAVEANRAAVHGKASAFTRLAAPCEETVASIRTRSEFQGDTSEDVRFPIDIVYTWVDGSDPEWQRRRAEVTATPYHPEAASDARYISRDELRYSLRSVHMFAPWVRNIFVVTDDQVPAWLETNHPKIHMVSHKEIFTDLGALPTFNSRAIESQLHHIDGLSNHFLYLNDDMFFARPVVPNQFFTATGLSKYFPSKNLVPPGRATADVTPVQAGAMNNRELLERKFDRKITHTLQHVPYALRRDVLEEIEREFPAEYRATMMSRLRDLHTITVTSSLYHYYAYFTGRAVPGKVSYGYIRLDIPDLNRRLARTLARRDFDTLCLNDSSSSLADRDKESTVLAPFLERFFPVHSPYEKTNSSTMTALKGLPEA